MKFAFVAKHRHVWPVSWICAALQVSRSGFHAWLNRPASARSIYDEKLSEVMRLSFQASDRTYGARRVWRDVLEEGLPCGLHRIEHLMKSNGLWARPRRRGLPKDRGTRSVIAENLLARDFRADGPNQKWLADFTYVWTAEGWLYVAAVLDLFSRRIVGWSMKAERDASLVMDALMMAVWRRGRADALLHHSDQGSQYTSDQLQRLLADHGITCSMSRAGNVWDNSAMESFFSSLKTKRTARKVYRTRDAARSDVSDYIERFYNSRRRHSKPGYISPIEFEAHAMLPELAVHGTGSRPSNFFRNRDVSALDLLWREFAIMNGVASARLDFRDSWRGRLLDIEFNLPHNCRAIPPPAPGWGACRFRCGAGSVPAFDRDHAGSDPGSAGDQHRPAELAEG
jgi:putative transposase